MLFNLFLGLMLVFASCKNIPDTILSINVNNYLGHWMQVYGSPTNVIFQGYGTCITADYGILDNGNIDITNSQLNMDRELEQITGYGYYKNISEPGKLTVHLQGVPVDSPYWIVKLGEIKNNQYQYSIITIPSGISLWVLVRNMSNFIELYDNEITDFLNEYNFKYTSISQDDCNK